eukprot:6787436-Ditylum_brightwellii.AAC.2
MECCDFQDAGGKPEGNYQCTTLHMVFDCKQGLRRKARLVAGGHLNDLLENKVYSSTIKEFEEDLIRKIVVVRKALYGLATSYACFHDHLFDTLRAMDFLPTRFDRDVWIMLSKNGKTFEYICTHVDN